MFGTNDLEVPLVGAEDVAYSQPLSDGHHACIHEIQVDVSVGMEEFNAATDVCRKKVSNFQRALLEAIQRVERAVFWWGRSPAIPEEGALSCALRRGGTVAGELGCGEMLLMKK